MIDATKLQSSSLFAGFANVSGDSGSLSIPGNQVVGSFGSVIFTFDIKRPSLQVMQQVAFQVIGPATSTGITHDPNLWKNTIGDFVDWLDIDSSGVEIRCDVIFSGDVLRLRVIYQNLTFGATTVVTPVTVNAKIYFFQYPWE